MEHRIIEHRSAQVNTDFSQSDLAYIKTRANHLFGLVILLTLISFALIWLQNPSWAQGDCPNANLIDEVLPTGSRWQMCWEHKSLGGIVFHNVYYTTPDGLRRKVLKQAGLAQIYVPYDDGNARYHHVTDDGLGGQHLAHLTTNDCLDGILLTHESKAVLCKQIQSRGYIYKYYSRQRQGNALTLYSVSQLNQQIYIVQWRFLDDGTIEPSIGHSGQLRHQGQDAQYGWPLNQQGEIGIGYTNNYYWRLDFDIGENGNDDIVEEFEVHPANADTQRVLAVTRLTSEISRSINPATKRSWRVRAATLTNSDGHTVSYHLEPMQAGHRYIGPANEPWTHNDLYITTHKSCEQFVSHNPAVSASGEECGTNVSEFVNGESVDGADIVVWYGVTSHHLPRAEDKPYLNLHWDGFQVVPRDWSAQNPL